VPNVLDRFLISVDRHPDRPALWADGRELSYAELHRRAAELAAAIGPAPAGGGCCAIFACRSVSAYAGILGALLAGWTYMPLNPRFPEARNRRMVASSEASVMVVDTRCLEPARLVLAQCSPGLRVVLADLTTPPAWASAESPHHFVTAGAVGSGPAPLPRPFADDALAYLLFTSGSTGEPKGVGVTHANLAAYIEAVTDRYRPTPEDRFSQMFDLTFDLAMHDLFVCWSAAACLYVIPEDQLMAPDRFVREHALTVWFSVPSAAGILKRLKRLKPACFPSLRWSLFCGEPLPTGLAGDWCAAAPNSTVENLYGPTEATIAFTVFRFVPDDPAAEDFPVVPLGLPLPGQELLVVDERCSPLADGMEGELCLGGTQVTPGYWHNPELTADRFVAIAAEGRHCRRWYRTGDLARLDAKVGYVFLGRVDRQVKIRGFRVELQEIEAVLRRAAGTELVAVLTSPPGEVAASSVVAFICGGAIATDAVLNACREALPDYMVPAAIHPIDEMPRNFNGKIDYKALTQYFFAKGNG